MPFEQAYKDLITRLNQEEKMNHLEEAKDMSENKKGYDGQEEIIAHTLIVIAETNKSRQVVEVTIEKHLGKIAEQLEKMNKNEAARWDREVTAIAFTDEGRG